MIVFLKVLMHACVRQAVPRRQRCGICGTDSLRSKVATKVTYDDRLAASTPAFWCTECYEAMHYDKSGRLLYQHMVFPYQIN